MQLVKPSYEIIDIDQFPLQKIELAGRTCYKSEDRITHDSAEKFCEHLIDREHLSVIEHANMTVRFVIDRGVSHELVRHRLCAFSQESTRYCNYKDKVVFVIPPWTEFSPGVYNGTEVGHILSNIKYDHNNPSLTWLTSMIGAETDYKNLLDNGWTPQQARSVLPNSLKTEIVVTANLREWRHIFQMRTQKAAHPQMREIMIPLLEEVHLDCVPVLFEGIYNDLQD
jgi:thymidylate synthase (FAD)